MGKRILIVGSGGREHALAWKLSQSPEVDSIFSTPGNAGTERVGQNLEVPATDIDGLVRAAREHRIDLVVVGPEAPLAAGLVDRLADAGIAAFGPSQKAAQLESSKGFAKEFMMRHDIPTAGYRVFDDAEEACAYVEERRRAMVVKADGLAGGKGVIVANTVRETLDGIDELMVGRVRGDAGKRIVLEEVLDGPEVSFHVISDGERYVALAAAQDHKRLEDGDVGPNTGGMGAYSPPPIVDAALEKEILERVVEPTLAGMLEEGIPFRGALFVGLMIHDGRPRVLEYNVRFGDPETEAMLARMGSDLLPILEGSARGDLGSAELTWSAPASLSVVLASAGYPAAYEKGRLIFGIEAADAQDGVTVFQAGTRSDGPDVVTSGGRVLCITAIGPDIPEAARRAYAAVESISFDGEQHRNDIGWQAR